MKYNNEPYALLENGKIEKLYYTDQKGKPVEPRMFYKQGKTWWLDHDEFIGMMFALFHDKIVRFLKEEDVEIQEGKLVCKEKTTIDEKG